MLVFEVRQCGHNFEGQAYRDCQSTFENAIQKYPLQCHKKMSQLTGQYISNILFYRKIMENLKELDRYVPLRERHEGLEVYTIPYLRNSNEPLPD